MLRRRITFVSLLSVMSFIVTMSPGLSAYGGEIVGTQLVYDVSAIADTSSIRVLSVEDFDPAGGFAVIDQGTSAEEWVTYARLDLSGQILDGIVRLEPADHSAGAAVQPATSTSTIPDLETPSIGNLGPLPQPVIAPVSVDPPDLGPTVVDTPDLDPVGADPTPIAIAGPDPDPVGADAPPLHVDGTDPPLVGVDPDPVSVVGPDPDPVGADAPPLHVDGTDPPLVGVDPEPVSVVGPDPGPVGTDPDAIEIGATDPGPISVYGPPVPPLEIFVVRDPVCTPSVLLTGEGVEAVRQVIESLLRSSQTSDSTVGADAYATYLSQWPAYLESTNAPSAAWQLIYQLDEILAELAREGVPTLDPVFSELTQLVQRLLANLSPADTAATSTTAFGEIGEIVVPEFCLSDIDAIQTPEIHPPPVDLDLQPIPGVYEDPDPISIDPAPLPDVYRDPQPVGTDPEPVSSIDYDPQPVELDPPKLPDVYRDPQPVGTDPEPVSSIDYDPQPVQLDIGKLPDVYEDPEPAIIDPVEVDDQTIDPPDPAPATEVDAASVTESLIGGAGLPVGVKVWGSVPIIDVPVSEPAPRSAATTTSTTPLGPGEGAWSCYYYETTYTNGGFIEGGPPDTNYAVDTALGARTYNRAYNQAYDLTRNTSHSWAAAGHDVTYNNNSGRTRKGAVVIPWKVAGRFDLAVSCSFDGACGQAEARTNVEIVLRDVTERATLATRTVPEFHAEGDTVANYGDQGEEKIEFTYQPGHNYKATIRITGYSTTDIPFPGLGARATNDAFQGQRRAFMEHVQWQLYGNQRVNCG